MFNGGETVLDVENKTDNSVSSSDNEGKKGTVESVAEPEVLEAPEEFDFLKCVKTLLGITSNDSDDILNLLIEIVQEEVFTYCNTRKLPDRLRFVICQLAADLYRSNKNKNNGSSMTGSIVNITEDGRSVSFSTSDSELQQQAAERVSKLALLQRYRKLYRL